MKLIDRYKKCDISIGITVLYYAIWPYYIILFLLSFYNIFFLDSKVVLYGIIVIYIIIPFYLTFSLSRFFIRYKVLIREFIITKLNNKVSLGDKTFQYSILGNKEKISIWRKSPFGKKIMCADKNMVILTDRKKRGLYIIPNYKIPIIKYYIRLDKFNFEGLIENSKIESIMILPYTRKINENYSKRMNRICLITDKCQIYHNNPKRELEYDAFPRWEDIVNFQESVIWDIPGRKFPQEKPLDFDIEREYKGLPQEVYQYHPAIIQTRKCNRFGSEFFGKHTFVKNENGNLVKVGRFYLHSRSIESNPFLVMGGHEYNNKIALLGTYRSNTNNAVRVCVFASSDGGRQWYCKYEFGDLGEYSFTQGIQEQWGKNWGNLIKCDWYNTKCDNTKLYIRKRKVNYPSSKKKEFVNPFSWGDKLYVNRIDDTNGFIAFEFEQEHNLSNGNIICCCYDDQTIEKEWQWMIKKENSSGPLFKVEVKNEKTIILHEYVMSEDNNICCRHIHHINRIKDGFLIGTGEVYPNSWLMYFELKECEKAIKIDASDYFRILRLNSTEKSIQRTIGVIWNEQDNTIVFASDSDILEKNEVEIPEGRTYHLSRNSVGVYKGNFKDIDDTNKFVCILDTLEVSYFFKKIYNYIFLCGQNGEMYICKNDKWINFILPTCFERYLGATYEYFVFDDYLIRIE